MSGERTSVVYQYLESGEHVVFCAPWFRREGLCLFIYNDHELAVAAAAEKARLYGYDIDLGDTTDIVGFLRRMAGIGFAGAVLNDLVPVIFCRREDGTPAFLRSLQNHEGGFSHFELLLDDGTWDVSVAIEGITPIQDQKLFDSLIGGMIGQIPFRGYQDDWTPMTWSDVASGELPVIDASEGAAPGKAGALSGQLYLPIFSRFDFLEQFVSERGIDPATVKRRDVDDLAGLTRLAVDREALVLLNPGQHRADTAALGWREKGVALTSYSGRWFSADGRKFHSGSAAVPAAAEETAPPRNLAEELEQRKERELLDSVGDGPSDSVTDEIPENLLDTSLEEVELVVPGDQVESGSVNDALAILCSAFNDTETLRWAGGRFHFRFPDAAKGQDSFNETGVRNWLRTLERLLPVLAYFLSAEEGGQQDVARALLGAIAGGEEEDPEAPSLAEYVEDRALMILAMGDKYGVEVRAVCEAMAATFSHQLPEHFFIEPQEFNGPE